jgi:hypothetical protein
MPSYDFLNKNTGEVEEHRMSYTALEQFKLDCTRSQKDGNLKIPF